MTYYQINKNTDTEIILVNGKEAVQIKIGDLDKVKHALSFGDNKVPEDDKVFGSTNAGESYVQAAKRNITIKRTAIDKEISFTAADKAYESIDEAVNALIKPHMVSPLVAAMNFSKAEAERFMPRFEEGMRKKMEVEIPNKIKRLQEKFGTLNATAIEKNWTINKLHSEQSQLTKEIDALKKQLGGRK